MIKPINCLGYIRENYRLLLEDYNWLNFLFSFIVLPIGVAILLSNLISLELTKEIFEKSLIFFSIIIGFLINVLVLLILENKKEEKANKLSKHLSYQILNTIFLGIFNVLLILFYITNGGFYFEIKRITVNFVELISWFLFSSFILYLLNILRKFSVYIQTKYPSK